MPRGTQSGLKEANKILKDVKGIEFRYLRDVDVVRHQLVKDIINAYDHFDSKKENSNYVKEDKRGENQ